jgi:small ligand-binding sensory domain FIST
MKSQAAIGTGDNWRDAVASATSQLSMLTDGTQVDLAILFASPDYALEYADLVAEAYKATGATVLIGCSGQGVIGPGREVENEPALALEVFSLPGARLRVADISQADLNNPDSWLREVDVDPEKTNAWLVFADPFSIDSERLLEVLSTAYPDKPLIGGLASADPYSRSTQLFLNGQLLDHGGICLALGGGYTVKTVVSQGCMPIGETWTITGVKDNVIETIGMRPALEVLMDTYHSLPPLVQERARSNLLVGLAMNEYQDEFRRGDFLIRNIQGVIQESGAIAIGALPREGQTIQFQIRDPEAADEELNEILSRVKLELGATQPVGALLCSCNGRGIGLFGAPHHDAHAVEKLLGQMPVAGFFCNGEIGPVGGKNFLHGFTASMALIVPKDA